MKASVFPRIQCELFCFQGWCSYLSGLVKSILLFFLSSSTLTQVIGWQEAQDTHKKHQHKVTFCRNTHVLVQVICKNSAKWNQSLREQDRGGNAELSLFLWEMFPVSTGHATHRAAVLRAYTPWVCCSSLHLVRAGARYPQWLYNHCNLCWFNRRKVENSVMKPNPLCLHVPTQRWV